MGKILFLGKRFFALTIFILLFSFSLKGVVLTGLDVMDCEKFIYLKNKKIGRASCRERV